MRHITIDRVPPSASHPLGCLHFFVTPSRSLPRPHRKHGFLQCYLCPCFRGLLLLPRSLRSIWSINQRIVEVVLPAQDPFFGSYAGSTKHPALNVHLMTFANHITFHTSVKWLIKIADAGKVLFEAVSSFWTHQRGYTSSDFLSPRYCTRAGFNVLLTDLVTASFL